MELSKFQKIRLKIDKVALYTVSLLPMKCLYVLSDFAYIFVSQFYRKKVVRTQLAEAFPEKSKEELRTIEKKFYHHLCDLFVEIVKQASMSKEEMMKRMKFIDVDLMNETYFDEKDTFFLMLGHYGNWEWIASLQYWTPRIKCSQIYHPLYNDVADQIFLDLREQYGGVSIPMKQTVRKLIQLRKEGLKVINGMIADQLPKWNAIHHFTPFLNHDTAVFTGAEQIGKKLPNSTFFYGRVTKPKRGYYECQMIPVAMDPEEYPDFDITDKYFQMLEEDIKAHPELWLWTHKRWRRTKEEWLERQKSEK